MSVTGRIPIVGKIKLKCKINNQAGEVEFYIAENDQLTLIGLVTCIDFQLVKLTCMVDQAVKSSYEWVKRDYKDLCSGQGCLQETCHIQLKEGSQPVITPTRKIPFALMDKFKAELDSMENNGIVSKVTKPTEWCSGVVLVEKPNGQLRVCLDPRPLNKCILRSIYPLPTFEYLKAKLAGASIFSVLDAKSAFWCIPLDESSADLCTFSTPFGRYQFLRLPYGLSIAPEKFQQIVSRAFEDFTGVCNFIDDFLIYGRNQAEHDQRLKLVLDKLREINLKLNIDKCKFGLSQVSYLGHVFDKNGVSADETKVLAIKSMPIPSSVQELQRFLGMVNYLGSYIPNLAKKMENLRKLLKKDVIFQWQESHTKEFNLLKDLLCKKLVLVYYNPKLPITITCDSSKDSVGSAILHNKNVIAYASKALTESQQNWAQIEKEHYAIWFAVTKFHQYVYGQNITVETDHKPLVSLFKKPLCKVPTRLQRLMLKLQCYIFECVFKSGKSLYIADTLSRIPMKHKHNEKNPDNDFLESEFKIHCNLLINNLSVTPKKFQLIKDETSKDEIFQKLYDFYKHGWPIFKNKLPDDVKPYYMYRDEIHFIQDVAFKNNCIIIPKSMRKEILNLLHVSHSGVKRTINLAKEKVFWPFMVHDISDMVGKCSVCLKYKPCNQKETLINHDLPVHPWETVGVDLFQYFNQRPKDLPELDLFQDVMFKKSPDSNWSPAKVVKTPEQTRSPCSYVVKTPEGDQYRGNRVHLRESNLGDNVVEESDESEGDQFDTPLAKPSMPVDKNRKNPTTSVSNKNVTRSGRVVLKPDRLNL